MKAPRLVLGCLLLPCAGWCGEYIIATLAGGALPVTPMPAARASVGDPPRVAVDPAGNLYFGSLHSVFRVDRGGTLTAVAGTGRVGNSGDGGPAKRAQLNYPDGIAVDAGGVVYVSDRDANAVRRISGGVIGTVAGMPLNGPTGIALDADGNLYIADTGNNCVRKVSPQGAAGVVAGSGAAGYAGDGGPAASALLNQPEGVAVDDHGNVYIADTLNNRVRKVGPDGTISTVAGTGLSGFNGDDQPAASASVTLPTDVAVDAAGRLYIADFGNSRIRRVMGGAIDTAAGAAAGEPFYEGGSALSLRLGGPTGVAIDAEGNVYIAEASIGSGSGLARGDFRIWKVSPEGVIATAAGNGIPSYSGDGGAAGAAQLNTPASVAVDGADNLFVADSLNHRVRRISPDGLIATVAGAGTAGFSGDTGPPPSALLNTPGGVAVDPGFHLYIADSMNARIRRVDPGGAIFTWAGNGNFSYYGDGGAANTASVNRPGGVAADAKGNVFVADTMDNAVRKIDAGGAISTVAGTGERGFGGDGGPAAKALLNRPEAVAVDAAGNLYIADTGNHRVRKVDAQGAIATLAPSAALDSPAGIAVDGSGTLYIADTGHNRVLAVGADGSVSTIAGTGDYGYSGDGGPAAAATLNHPRGIALGGNGNIYVADAGNDAIRVLQPAGGSPRVSSVVNGASNRPGAIAPGEVLAIYGTGLGPATLAQSQLDENGRVASGLAGVSVLFNGIPSPVIYASETQLGVAAPYGLSGESVAVVARFGGAAAPAVTLPLAAAAPAIFTQDSSGRGQALAANQDGSLNGGNSAAAPGSYITLYATGEGQTSPGGLDGALAPAQPPRPVLPVTATIGGRPAEVQYAGGAPGMMAGVMQVNVKVPEGVEAGDAEVALRVGDASSPGGVTVAVGR